MELHAEDAYVDGGPSLTGPGEVDVGDVVVAGPTDWVRAVRPDLVGAFYNLKGPSYI